MARLNVMKLIEDNRGKINTKYDLAIRQIDEIESNSLSKLDLICNIFVFGYMQGIKAAKAELRYGGNK